MKPTKQDIVSKVFQYIIESGTEQQTERLSVRWIAPPLLRDTKFTSSQVRPRCLQSCRTSQRRRSLRKLALPLPLRALSALTPLFLSFCFAETSEFSQFPGASLSSRGHCFLQTQYHSLLCPESIIAGSVRFFELNHRCCIQSHSIPPSSGSFRSLSSLLCVFVDVSRVCYDLQLQKKGDVHYLALLLADEITLRGTICIPLCLQIMLRRNRNRLL